MFYGELAEKWKIPKKNNALFFMEIDIRILILNLSKNFISF